MTQHIPSVYERNALAEIAAWKEAGPDWFTRLNSDLGRLASRLPGAAWFREKIVPGVDRAIELTIGKLVSQLNDFAHWTVRVEGVYEAYRAAGFPAVNGAEAIAELDLLAADKLADALALRYKTLAGAEGAAAGYVGLPGLAPDILALITLNQRAIAEYATYYGFDISLPEERVFALNLLALASSPDEAARTVALTQLLKVAEEVTRTTALLQVERNYLQGVVLSIAQSLGMRLTKAKLAQVVPVTGAALGAGFNAYFTARVCEAAYHLYRQRFLTRKYGSGPWPETVVSPVVATPEVTQPEAPAAEPVVVTEPASSIAAPDVAPTAAENLPPA